MTDAAIIQREPKKRGRTAGDAWAVGELADHWRCSPRQIYDLIDAGLLRTFSISRKSLSQPTDEKRGRERGTRIADEERIRWERESAKATKTEMSASGGADGTPLPSTAIQGLIGDAVNA